MTGTMEAAPAQTVAGMITTRQAPEHVLRELSAGIERSIPGSAATFCRMDSKQWTEDTEQLSEELFAAGSASGMAYWLAATPGWARHVFSGTGELLGILQLRNGTPLGGREEAQLDAVCTMAALAIEQRNLLNELVYKAEHDPVTGLWNRQYFERLLQTALRQAKAGGKPVALLSLNLDRFRVVNEVIGHSAGNRLLEMVGRRLSAALGPEAMIARVGGDEFSAILCRKQPETDAGISALQILESFAAPFCLDGHELYLTASIGIAWSDGAASAQAMEREANIALYHAKRNGKARAAHFHPALASTPPERLEMEKRLRYALERREMFLCYQPQIDFKTGKVRGAEALLRWRPEGLGVVSPAAFVPILEETGLIVEFGQWVLREACRQGREWLDRLKLPLRLGVNVSAVQFARKDYLDRVREALDETGYPAELLELELTESVLVDDFAGGAKLCRRLQELGVTLALDDFGTGQSSLSYLHQLPLETRKIDQSFVRQIGEGDTLPPLLETILQMAERMRMTTVAEGIETGRHASLLARAGCDVGQGYYFAKPLPAPEMEVFSRRCYTNLYVPGTGSSGAVIFTS